MDTLTPILKKLESPGYLRGRRDPDDERQVRISLTAKGRAILDQDPGAVRETVATLRDNLLRATKGKPRKS